MNRKYWYLKVIQINSDNKWKDYHTYDIHDMDDMKFLEQELRRLYLKDSNIRIRIINRRKIKPHSN